MRAVRRTRLFPFADDVSVERSGPDDGAGPVRETFESASRVGRHDLGQNGRNLPELLRGRGREDPALKLAARPTLRGRTFHCSA